MLVLLQPQNPTNTVSAGGIAGVNSGIISEVEVDAKINNDSSANAGSRMGLLVGVNLNLVRDALIRPWASLETTVSGAKLGQVFGSSGSSSVAKRIVSANEMIAKNHPSSYFHFVAENISGASYEDAFALGGGVFKIFTTNTLTTSECSGSVGGAFTYTMTSAFADQAGYTGGYYVLSNGGSGNFSRRITGTHTNSTATINSTSSDLTMECGVDGFKPNLMVYPVSLISDFSVSGLTSTTPASFKLMETFCPSSSMEEGNLNYSCPANEFDMVEDTPGGIGFNRLLSAHLYREQNGRPSANRPIWTMSDEGYPRLFITD